MSAYGAEVEPHDGLGFGWRITLRSHLGGPDRPPGPVLARTWALTRRRAERRAIALVAEAERQDDLAAERAARAFTVRSQSSGHVVYPRPPADAPTPRPPVADELRAKGYSTHRVTPDPLRDACPRCGALPGQTCRMVGEVYEGVPRDPHCERTGRRS